MYKILQSKISQCDVVIEKILNITIDEDNNKKLLNIDLSSASAYFY